MPLSAPLTRRACSLLGGIAALQALVYGYIAARASRSMPTPEVQIIDALSGILAAFTLLLGLFVLWTLGRHAPARGRIGGIVFGVGTVAGVAMALSLPEEARSLPRFWFFVQTFVFIPLSMAAFIGGSTSVPGRSWRTKEALRIAPIALHASAYTSAALTIFVAWRWIEETGVETHDQEIPALGPIIFLLVVVLALLLGRSRQG